jgi:UDPglucose 6-dehydrogenase
MMKIGIVGGGFVGSATALLECAEIEVIIYDLDPARCKPADVKITDLVSCDLVFVCVPTPTYEDGSCNTTIVRRAIQNLRDVGVERIVLRSTVPPGTSDSMGVMFMPEFLTEANWRTDFLNCASWVFGVHDDRREEESAVFAKLLAVAAAHGKIKHTDAIFVSCKEAELAKYVRNNFLALKVSFFNEMYRLCEAVGADYAALCKSVRGDPRIGGSHMTVPGPDGHYGFGGTCLPKDTSALESYMKSVGVASPVVSAMVHRNRVIDRPEHDWESDPRAFTKAHAS